MTDKQSLVFKVVSGLLIIATFVGTMLFCSVPCGAVEYTRQGNTFVTVSSKSNTKDAGSPTKFTWKDVKGNSYPVLVSKKGKFFVIRTSAKTGKQYKYYLPKEIQEQMAKDYE